MFYSPSFDRRPDKGDRDLPQEGQIGNLVPFTRGVGLSLRQDGGNLSHHPDKSRGVAFGHSLSKLLCSFALWSRCQITLS